MQQCEFLFDQDVSPTALFTVMRAKLGAPCGLLESVSFDERNFESLLAFCPRQTVRTTADTLVTLRQALADCRPIDTGGKFAGGLIGRCEFGVYGEWEAGVSPLTDGATGLFHEYTLLVAFDHRAHTVRFLTTLERPDFTAECEGYLDAALGVRPQRFDLGQLRGRTADFATVGCDVTQADFFAKVQQAQQAIARGEVFQVIVSGEFSIEMGAATALDLYRLLRTIEPSTHLFYFDHGDDGEIVGASPEILGQKIGREVLYRPIAGTRHRGQTVAEDRALLAEMRADPKENAEHDMLLDLGRNDLGRVCGPGTVRVTREKYAKHFATVMHMVSDLRGELRPEVDQFEFYAAVMPAGTLTGAPKVRATQLLTELEDAPRGVYGGTVGYWSVNGNMEHAIAIRTMVVKDGVARYRCGAGVVADSDPRLEWKEIHNKARTLTKVVQYVQRNSAQK